MVRCVAFDDLAFRDVRAARNEHVIEHDYRRIARECRAAAIDPPQPRREAAEIRRRFGLIEISGDEDVRLAPADEAALQVVEICLARGTGLENVRNIEFPRAGQVHAHDAQRDRTGVDDRGHAPVSIRGRVQRLRVPERSAAEDRDGLISRGIERPAERICVHAELPPQLFVLIDAAAESARFDKFLKAGDIRRE